MWSLKDNVMGTPPFDLASLASFEPSLLICPACRAFHSVSHPPLMTLTNGWRCSLCHTEIIHRQTPATIEKLEREGYLRRETLRGRPHEWGLFLQRLDMLGYIAGKLINGRLVELKTLLGLFELAQDCIHVATHGLISEPILAHLNEVAVRVPVYAAVSHMSTTTLWRYGEKLRRYPRLHIERFGVERGRRRMPHQKLIVIDGLLAISGSLNLSVLGWERAPLDLEIIHIHSAPEEVLELNNRYFAPLWRDRLKYRERRRW